MTAAIPGYGAHLPDDLLLGHVAWYTITKPRKTHQELMDLVTSLKLSPTIMPPPPRMGDAFKRACRYSERSGLPIPLSDNRANFLIRSVAQTLTDIERHLMLEIVDAEGRHLEYIEAAQLRFDRDKLVLHVRKRLLPDELDPMVQETLNRFNANFDDATKYIDAQVIRRMVRDQLQVSRAIPVRPEGSVYFIPVAEKATTEALEVFLPSVSSGSTFTSIPLPNTEKQREMVKMAFEDSVHEEATSLIAKLRNHQENDDQITARRWEEYRNKYNELKRNYAEYGEMVNDEMSKAEIELSAVETQLTDFLTKGLVKV